MIETKQRQYEELAARLLKTARGEIVVGLRFLDTALFRLKDHPGQTDSFAVDGEKICYNIAHVFRRAEEEREGLTRDILHMTMHCLFAHLFRGGRVDPLRYDLACDIAAENIINELELPFLTCKRQYHQDQMIETLRKKIYVLTAEKIYRFLLEEPYSPEELEAIAQDFCADDHSGWYQQDFSESTDKADPDFGELGNKLLKDFPSSAQWLDSGRVIAMDLELFSKEWGTKAGDLRRTLALLQKKTASFRDFLLRFADKRETLRVNDEEFDYIFYTYGLSLYQNMPLIEPLEYKEEKKIGEFVIAIDTSASISLSTARNFLNYIWNIFSEKTVFSSAFHLLLLQCDTEIRYEKLFRGKEEMTAALEKTEWLGGGGTDFRPVFRRVNELIDKDFFNDLRGLLFLSDGFGTFPLEKPAYDTAFILIEAAEQTPSLPSWAMKVVVDEKEVTIR